MSLHEDMSAAERDFFASRGRNTDALLAENKDGVQRIADETPVQSVPAAETDQEKGSPVHSQAPDVTPPSPSGAPNVESAPAPIEDAEEATDPQTGHPKRVRWARYQAAEDARRALEKEKLEWTAQQARIEERLRLFNEALQDDQPQADEDPEPNKLQDAYAWMEWSARQRERDRAEFEAYRQQQNSLTAEQQVVQAYRDDAARFAAQNPIFHAMYPYLLQHRDMELQIAEPDWTPEQRSQAIKEEEFYRAQRHLQAGRSPAQFIYQMARARGFDGWYAAQQQNNGSASPGVGNGAAVPVANELSPRSPQTASAPANSQVPSAVQQVQNIAANQAAARSLSNGGGAPLQNIDARALASMSQEEFEAVFNRLQNSRNKAQLRELMGY